MGRVGDEVRVTRILGDMETTTFDPTPPLPDMPDPWASSSQPSLRPSPPFHMTDMIDAEPGIAHAGGSDGLDIVRRILAEAGGHLSPSGALVMEVGRGRHILEQEFPRLPFLWLDTAESEGEVLALAAHAFR